MLKLILYIIILIIINVIVIYNTNFITYEYYIFSNIFLLAAYIQYEKILFLRYLFKEQSKSALKYYKYLQKILFLLLYIISVIVTLLEGQYQLSVFSFLFCIVSIFSIKNNWSEMKKDRDAMFHASPK